MKEYNRVYRHNDKYSMGYKGSPYLQIWEAVSGWIADNDLVLDLGCGPGQFAEFFNASVWGFYIGVDYSGVAIKKAMAKGLRRTMFFQHDFFGATVKEIINRGHYDKIIMLEVLEHIGQDKQLIASIPSGSGVIFSVPDYNSKTHVRIYKSLRGIEKRYRDYLTIKNTYTHRFKNGNTIFAVNAIRDQPYSRSWQSEPVA